MSNTSGIVMENEKNTEKLAGYIIKIGGLAVVVALCWYFKNILIYVTVAFVVSMIGRPFMRLLKKLKIKGKSAPDWLLSVLTIVIILSIIILIFNQMLPLISKIISDASSIRNHSSLTSNPIDEVNAWLIGVFPNLNQDFDITTLFLEEIR